MSKDLRLILQEALTHRFPMVLGTAAYSLYQRSENMGLAYEDVIAVVRAYTHPDGIVRVGRISLSTVVEPPSGSLRVWSGWHV